MHRLMLEAAQCEDNAFVTLTYDDASLPEGGSLRPRDLQLWIKRYRRHYAPFRFRFFGVGEYGDQTWRPHYHVALFGVPSCLYGRSRYALRNDCCRVCDGIRETWGLGHVYVGELTPESCGYVASYVVKKLNSDKRSLGLLNGRHPEFTRQSRHPGIGFSSMREVAKTLQRHGLVSRLTDVPMSLQHGSRKLPLGRYLRRVLREELGWDGKITQEAMDEIAAELLPVRMAARADAENPSLRHHLVERDKGRLASAEARAKIFKQRRTI